MSIVPIAGAAGGVIVLAGIAAAVFLSRRKRAAPLAAAAAAAPKAGSGGGGGAAAAVAAAAVAAEQPAASQNPLLLAGGAAASSRALAIKSSLVRPAQAKHAAAGGGGGGSGAGGLPDGWKECFSSECGAAARSLCTVRARSTATPHPRAPRSPPLPLLARALARSAPRRQQAAALLAPRGWTHLVVAARVRGSVGSGRPAARLGRSSLEIQKFAVLAQLDHGRDDVAETWWWVICAGRVGGQRAAGGLERGLQQEQG